MSSYVSNGELHISLGSEEWTGYCEFLRKRLEELEGQKKAIEDKILEIRKILNPTVIIEDVDDGAELTNAIPDEEPYLLETTVTAEKYLLIKDVAAKYKVTEQSVLAACQTGKVPCHKVGDEYRFTPSDMERLTSLMARKKLFAPATAKKAVKVNIRKKPEGMLVCADVCNQLGCTYNEYTALKTKGYLNGTLKDGGNGSGSYFYFSPSEVDALEEMVKAEGGIKPFLKKARAI